MPLQAMAEIAGFIADTEISFRSQYKMPALFSGAVAMLASSCAASDPASALPDDVEIIEIMLS